MLKRCANLVLIALMLVLPVQGTAAALAVILCGADDHHAVKAHSQALDDHDASYQDIGSDGRGAQGHASYFCCQHIVTGIPLGIFSITAADLPIYHSSLTSLSSLFIPEQPQRPPRS